MYHVQFNDPLWFKWPVAERYSIEPPPTGLLLGEADDAWRLVAHGNSSKRSPVPEVGVGRLWPGLLMALKGRPEEFSDRVLEVAKVLGMLTKKSEDGDGESLREWSDFVDRLLDLAALSQKRGAAVRGPIARAEIELVPGSHGMGPTVLATPATLRDAILTGAAQLIAEGGIMRECAWDKTFFVAGGGGGVTRRMGATFCSDECRAAFNNEKAKQKRLAGEDEARRRA